MDTPQFSARSRQCELFLEALEKPTTESRKTFLNEACGGDTALREAVEGLLANHLQDTFLENSVSPVPDAKQADSVVDRQTFSEQAGDRIGHYRLLQKIGEGGMGVVYMAEQEKPVRRFVALKIIKLGMDTANVIARFEAERQALAMMDHPNIAKVLDGGTIPQSRDRPYFVMELVRGTKITDYCHQHQISSRDRLELFVKVCHAVQHAHQKGVIHRDLKPSNILVTFNDGVAVPKVIDFGIAKAIEGRLTDKTLLTGFEQFIGTPAYMSPEQAAMTTLDIDTRSDVYSLGVLLYELLTGRTPFDAQELLAVGLDELRRTIVEVEPTPPSKCLIQAMAATERTTARNSARLELGVSASTQTQPTKDQIERVRGDLDCIVMKCLEKDRRRRYQTANGLSEDIQRHLNHETIIARPASVAYRFQKLVQRNRIAFFSTTAVAAALLIGTAVSTWQAVRAGQAWKAEVRARAVAETERNRAQVETIRAEQENLAAQRNRYAAAMLLAQADWEKGQMAHLRQILEQTVSYPEKGFEWYYWQRMCRLDQRTFRDHDAPVSAIGYSPDGRHLASGGMDRTVRVWDVTNGRLIWTLRGHASVIRSVSFAPNGHHLISGAEDSTVRIWDLRTGKETRRLRGRVGAISPDGQSVLIGDSSGVVRLMDLSSGREVAILGEHEAKIDNVTFSPDGKRMLSGSVDREIRVWTPGNPTPLKISTRRASPTWSAWGEPNSIANFSPDGRSLVSGCSDRVLRVWDALTGRELYALKGHNELVSAVTFSPDGKKLASASEDGGVRTWDLETGAVLLSLKGHTDAVMGLAYSPDGTRIASCSRDRTVRVWDSTEPGSPRVQMADAEGLVCIGFSPDGGRLVTAAASGAIRLWDTDTLRETKVLVGHTNQVSHAVFSPDGSRISSGGHDGTLRLWNATTGEPIHVWNTNLVTVFASSISADGTRIASAGADCFVRVHDTSTGKELLGWRAHGRAAWEVKFSPDQQQLLSTGGDGLAKLWDAQTGRELLSFIGHRGRIIPGSFSSDGTKLVTGSADRSLRIWEVSTGISRMILHGHSKEIWSAGFSPDARRVVSGAFDKTTRLWDVSNGNEVLTLRGGSDYIMSAEFSPDGSKLAVAGNASSFELWEAASDGDVMRWNALERAAMERWVAYDKRLEEKRKTATNHVKQWLVLAPIPTESRSGMSWQIREKAIPNEQLLRPHAGDSVLIGGQHLSWSVEEFEDGLIDFNRVIGREAGKALAYAVCYVRSPVVRGNLLMKIACDDTLLVYLNGNPLGQFSGFGEMDQHTIADIRLEEGVNTVVFKVLNDYGAWLGAMRLVDEQENPVEGIQFTLTPD